MWLCGHVIFTKSHWMKTCIFSICIDCARVGFILLSYSHCLNINKHPKSPEEYVVPFWRTDSLEYPLFQLHHLVVLQWNARNDLILISLPPFSLLLQQQVNLPSSPYLHYVLWHELLYSALDTTLPTIMLNFHYHSSLSASQAQRNNEHLQDNKAVYLRWKRSVDVTGNTKTFPLLSG